MLHELLRDASGLSGRRRRQFNAAFGVHRLAEFAVDFASLRMLSAFMALEAEVQQIVQSNHWDDAL